MERPPPPAPGPGPAPAPVAQPGEGVSNTRLYLGNLPRHATKANVEAHFKSHGAGEITEVKLMSGFGFIEYKDAQDARDVVPDGSDFMGERLVVQFARGANRPHEGYEHRTRPAPRPRRTVHRMSITGLAYDTSWQDLKDFARVEGMDVVYSEINTREKDEAGLVKGYVKVPGENVYHFALPMLTASGFVEYETGADLQTAVDKLNETNFKGLVVRCIVDTQAEIPRQTRDRYARSRSPAGYRSRGAPPPPDYDYHDRRGPPRGYSPPRREDYRRRTPPPRDYYQDSRDDRYGGPPPPRRAPPEDYVPGPRGRYDDRYSGPPPPAPRGSYEPDPYANGHSRDPYARAPSPRRDARPYDRGGYEPRAY